MYAVYHNAGLWNTFRYLPTKLCDVHLFGVEVLADPLPSTALSEGVLCKHEDAGSIM